MASESNLILGFFPEQMGQLHRDFSLFEEDWVSVPKTIAAQHAFFTAFISKPVWDLIFPGLPHEGEAFGKTFKFLHYIVGFAADVADSIIPGREALMQPGYYDGEPLILRCIRVPQGFYLDFPVED